MLHVSEKYRIKDHPLLKSDASYGNNGAFKIPCPGDSTLTAFVMVSDGMGWEHVSVHIVDTANDSLTPEWEEMCWIKGLFWDEEDCVIQYHPAKSEYVNCHKHTLHLWRPVGQTFPIPPSIMVGPK